MDSVLKKPENCIFVVGAVLTRRREGQLEILAFRRLHSDTSGGKWEFPGGKIEDGETAEVALKREMQEELGVAVDLKLNLRPVIGESLSRYQYPNREIDLTLFWVQPMSWNFTLPEHEGLVWVGKDQAQKLDWLAADRPCLNLVFDFLQNHRSV